MTRFWLWWHRQHDIVILRWRPTACRVALASTDREYACGCGAWRAAS